MIINELMDEHKWHNNWITYLNEINFTLVYLTYSDTVALNCLQYVELLNGYPSKYWTATALLTYGSN